MGNTGALAGHFHDENVIWVILHEQNGFRYHAPIMAEHPIQ
jgi:hypothetical protein